MVISVTVSGSNGMAWQLARQLTQSGTAVEVLGTWSGDQTVIVHVNIATATAGYPSGTGFVLVNFLENYEDCSNDEFVNKPICTAPLCNLPVDVIALGDSPVDEGDPINFTASATRGVSYNWAGPNGFTSSLQNPVLQNATVLNSGTYTVTVASADGSTCTATATTVVMINAVATPASTTVACSVTATATSNAPVCLGSSVNLSVANTGATTPVTYTWTGPNGFSSTNQSPTFAAASNRVGTYTVTLTDANTCTATATLSVTLRPQPNAGADVSFCQPSASVTLTGASTGDNWTQAGTSPMTVSVNSLTGQVSGMALSGIYRFVLTNTQGCRDTVAVNVKLKPTAPPDLVGANALCGPSPQAELTGSPTSGITWSAAAGNPASAVVSNAGQVAGMSVNGIYRFVLNFEGCTDTTAIEVKTCAGGCVKPIGGPDLSLCSPGTSVDLPDAGVGQNWEVGSGNPVGSNPVIISSSGTVSGMTVDGRYMFILQGGTNCADTVFITRNARPNAGSDQSFCGPATTFILTAPPTGGSWIAGNLNPAVTTISGGAVSGMTANGAYRFVLSVNGCLDTLIVTRKAQPDAGPNYLGANAICSNVNTLQLTPITTGGTWVPQTGNPSVALISSTGNITNMSVNGTYNFIYTNTQNSCADTVRIERKDCQTQACTKPNAGTDIKICSNINTVNLPDGINGQTWSGMNTNPFTTTIDPTTGVVTGITQNGVYGYILTSQGSGSNCTDTVFVRRGTLALTTQSVCSPATTIFLPAAQAGQTWTAVTAGNPATATINNSGSVSGMTTNGLYKFLVSDGTCSDTAKVERKVCTAEYDLAIFKKTSNKTASLNQNITYTITVVNQGNSQITGIEVRDTLTTGVSFVSAATVRGSGTYNSSTKIWNVGTLAAGDSAILNITVKVLASGVWFSIAEITKADQLDVDSTPNNSSETEDDLDRVCVSVPVRICDTQKIVLTSPGGITNIQWYNGTTAIAGATSSTYTVTTTGSYYYVGQINGCPVTGCCPLDVLVENCCNPNLCVPVTMTRIKTNKWGQ
jgi:uncharacterized repeat protein (TIGR01451 family)